MRSEGEQDEMMKALMGIRDWAAKGEARGMGAKHGLELPEDADFPEETPGVEAPEPAPSPDAAAPAGEDMGPEAIEQLLALLADGG